MIFFQLVLLIVCVFFCANWYLSRFEDFEQKYDAWFSSHNPLVHLFVKAVKYVVPIWFLWAFNVGPAIFRLWSQL